MTKFFRCFESWRKHFFHNWMAKKIFYIIYIGLFCQQANCNKISFGNNAYKLHPRYAKKKYVYGMSKSFCNPIASQFNFRLSSLDSGWNFVPYTQFLKIFSGVCFNPECANKEIAILKNFSPWIKHGFVSFKIYIINHYMFDSNPVFNWFLKEKFIKALYGIFVAS